MKIFPIVFLTKILELKTWSINGKINTYKKLFFETFIRLYKKVSQKENFLWKTSLELYFQSRNWSPI